MIKTEDYQNEGIPYIRVQNLGWGTDLLLDNVVYISAENNEKIKSSQLKPNDVLFCKTGGTIGKTGIVPENLPVSNTTSHVGKITVNPAYNARYVFYVLSSNVGYRQFWEIACQKTTRPELSIAETRQIRLTWPSSRKEQDDIVSYLDSIVPEYDYLISEKQSLIEDLKVYKKSLIYEVVTGKRRVV
jgi:type I restriction enzyme S subunit